MDAILTKAKRLGGSLSVPPDKAITHRVLLIGAIAEGTTEVTPWSSAADCQHTLNVVERLGVRISRRTNAVRIEGKGLGGMQAPTEDLFCGDSGTTLRLCAGLLAGQPFSARLSAGESLSRRPMQRIIEPLTQMGARVEGRTSSKIQDVCPPIVIHGESPLKPIKYTLPVASAQVKSAILLAGLFAAGETCVVEPASVRDHTERIIQHYGGMLQRNKGEIRIKGGSRLTSPGSVVIPGDISSAAFLLVAAACVPGSKLQIVDVGLNPTRTHLLEVLRRMGSSIDTQMDNEDWEVRGVCNLEWRSLRATTLNVQEVPLLIDEVPLLMVAGLCAEGETVLEGIGELRVKETDRIKSMVEALRRMGGQLILGEKDTLKIKSSSLKGAIVDSRGDHRSAMALAVAALVAEGTTRVLGAECVEKSFPEFFESLRALTDTSTVKMA